jgi:two-component system NtrC family sensor kinase
LQRIVDVYAERMQQQHIGLKTDFAVALPTLRADAEQLYRSFTNIVLNAIEAMPTHGELTISCRPVPKVLVDFAMPQGNGTMAETLPQATAGFEIYTTNIEITFQDTGVGIPPEQLDAVFTPFWTTKPKGTGLGLALTHKIIEDHHGSVQITSQAGHGTVVTVLLPAVGADSAASA